MKKVKFYKVLNISSIFIYLLATILTSFLLIKFSIGAKTEGSGIEILILIFVNVIECFFVILLNLFGIITLIKDKDQFDDSHKLQYKKQFYRMLIMIIVSILTFIIQLFIV